MRISCKGYAVDLIQKQHPWDTCRRLKHLCDVLYGLTHQGINSGSKIDIIQRPSNGVRAAKMAGLFFSSIGQKNPYSDEEIRYLYHEAGSPAMLMVGIVQRLAEQIAKEEGE